MINCTARYARINGLTALPLRTGGASKFLVGLFATFVALLVLWCTAGNASAATYEESCSRRPMAQGLVGEQVTTCELRRVPSTITLASTPRQAHATHPRVRTPGRTTVVHYGARYGVRLASR